MENKFRTGHEATVPAIRMSELKKYNTIPLYIVEDHNEVVPFIHRAIGGRYLPMSGIVFVHFDSHPDLLIPADLNADDVFSKDIVYETQSIENWILPMVYAGHIRDVIWFKPPWCQQIQDKTVQFDVGKCSTTGYIRTSCKESYFVSETLYRPAEKLTKKKTLTLTVITVKPSHWSEIHTPANQIAGFKKEVEEGCQSLKGECERTEGTTTDVKSTCESIQRQVGTSRDQGLGNKRICHEEISKNEYRASNSKKKRQTSDDCIQNSESPPESDSPLSPGLIQQLEEVFRNFKDRHIILDIDLDFFSTKNPFQEMYSPRQFKLLQDLYVYDKPVDDSDEAIQVCVGKREDQLSQLKDIFSSMGSDPQLIPKHRRSDLILALVKDLRESFGNDGVDFGLLHDAGCTCDDTELPHHISTQGQITRLVDAVQELLCHLHKPTIITMARSSNDDYCPPDQVDSIQEQTLEILQDLYLKLDLTASY